MAEEATTALAFLYTALSTDATLMSYVTGIYRSIAPAGSTPPWVILSYQAGHDTLTANAWRVLTSDTYQVKVVGPESAYATLSLASARIDALLGRTSATGVLACYREQQIVMPELVDGVAWINIGGMFRIVI